MFLLKSFRNAQSTDLTLVHDLKQLFVKFRVLTNLLLEISRTIEMYFVKQQSNLISKTNVVKQTLLTFRLSISTDL